MASDQRLQGRGCAYFVAIVLSGLLAALKYAEAASTYTVGDSSGWNTGVDYTAWAKKYSFAQGDTIAFNYVPGLHSVNQVSQADYQSCSLNNALKSYTSGSDSVTLTGSNTYYFICGTPGHCQQGMKVAISLSSSTNPTPINPPTSGGSGSPATGGGSGSPTTGSRSPNSSTNYSQARSQPLSTAASVLFSMTAALAAFLA